MPRDYYEVLGVPRTATAAQLQKAYRTLARRNHPDVNKDPAAEERFKEINDAYHVLADPRARERYDRFGTDFRGMPDDVDAARYAGAGARAGPAGGGFGRGGGYAGGRGGAAVDLEELFGDLFGAGGAGHRRGAGAGRYGGMGAGGMGPGGMGAGGFAGADQEAVLPLSLEEAYTGGRRIIALAGREFDVTLPAGVADGQRIRLSGQGGRGHGEGSPGDLYLVVRMLPHPRFRVDGRDIGVDLPIAPWEGTLGATVSVPTPVGQARVMVPAGSSTGRRLRLRGQGMPNPRGTPGDLYAEVKVVVPATITDAERELYRRLSTQSSFDPRAEGRR